MKTAIIFGITGQDGSYLAELLLKQNYKVIGVTRRVSVDTLVRVKHILPKIKIVEGDITDGFNVSSIVNEYKPHEIYNLAAQSHVGTSFNQPSLTWDVTAGGCLNILEAIRYSGRLDQIKFYQASSSEMFGKNYSVDDTQRYQDENTPFMPQSPYAIAKLAAHHLVENYRNSYNMFACSGILFNHESERRGEKFVTRKITKWIGDFIEWESTNTRYNCKTSRFIIADDYITVPNKRMYLEQMAYPSFPKLRLGNLDAYRDWGHAEDYVRAMWLMVQQEKPDDYVIATGETHSVRDFLVAAFNHIDIEDFMDYVVIDPEFYRPSEVDFLCGRPSKAQMQLEWEPEISFTSLVKRMVEHDTHETRLSRSSL